MDEAIVVTEKSPTLWCESVTPIKFLRACISCQWIDNDRGHRAIGGGYRSHRSSTRTSARSIARRTKLSSSDIGYRLRCADWHARFFPAPGGAEANVWAATADLAHTTVSALERTIQLCAPTCRIRRRLWTHRINLPKVSCLLVAARFHPCI